MVDVGVDPEMLVSIETGRNSEKYADQHSKSRNPSAGFDNGDDGKFQHINTFYCFRLA
ncbi:hypothetical protein [Rhodopseudomonas sp. WA056]|uniref:hypothetical protein n=1 Tax=Rhodopseudomonas sp. WA056 TaxID=2269367 RepID=UPI0032E4BC5B